MKSKIPEQRLNDVVVLIYRLMVRSCTAGVTRTPPPSLITSPRKSRSSSSGDDSKTFTKTN